MRYTEGRANPISSSVRIIYDPDDSTSLVMTASGESKLYLSSSGEVGIGTTTPNANLEIKGALNTKGLFISSSGIGAAEVGEDFIIGESLDIVGSANFSKALRIGPSKELQFKYNPSGKGSGVASIEISSSLDELDFDPKVKFTSNVTMSKPLRVDSDEGLVLKSTAGSTSIRGGAGGITSSLAGYGINGTAVLWIDDDDGTRGTGYGAGGSIDLMEMYVGNNEIDVTLLGNPLHIKGDPGSGLLDTRGTVSMSAGPGGIYISSSAGTEIYGPISTDITASAAISASGNMWFGTTLSNKLGSVASEFFGANIFSNTDVATHYYGSTIGFSNNPTKFLGNVTASINVSASGDIIANNVGWHGSNNRIKILPRDFQADDVGRPAMTEDDVTDERYLSSHGTAKLYASVEIPSGFTATHVMVYGSDTGQTHTTYLADLTTKDVVEKGAATALGTEKSITNVTSSTLNYLLVEVSSDGTDDEIHGGYITIIKT